MTVVYVAGPFRGPTHWDIWQNVNRAAALALEVWKLGAVALCPHMNTFPFQHECPDEVWLEGDLELVKRCDVVLMMADWTTSQGAIGERIFAESQGIPVLYTINELREWLT